MSYFLLYISKTISYNNFFLLTLYVLFVMNFFLCSDYLFDSDGESEDFDCDQIKSNKNLLLVSGDSGVSKTDSVYACAQELGFQVIEVNASEKRNALKIQNLVGEAVKSQNLISGKVSRKNHSTSGIQTLYSKKNKKATHLTIDDVGEKKKNSNESSRRQLTLILFDELETIGDDEKGFASAVQSICKSSRRPIVLTSQNHSPSCLSQRFQSSRIQFERQCIRDVCIHTSMCLLSQNMRTNLESIMLLSMVGQFARLIVLHIDVKHHNA